jgi:hypothetical protein
MAAPTNAAREKSSCQLGAVHTWHLADITLAAANVRLRALDFYSPRPPTIRNFRLDWGIHAGTAAIGWSIGRNLRIDIRWEIAGKPIPIAL